MSLLIRPGRHLSYLRRHQKPPRPSCAQVFLIGGGETAELSGAGVPETSSIPSAGCVIFTADEASTTSGVSRGGRGGTGAISTNSPPRVSTVTHQPA